MLDDFIKSCWLDFQKVKHESYVVRNSIPILWFGDMNAYEKSDIRIVTVGINPSDVEFFHKGVCCVGYRFPKAKGLRCKGKLLGSDVCSYKQSMNEYFTNTAPHRTPTWYKPWFGNYETALNALGASYNPSFYGNTEITRTAIHIDMCSSIASMKWSSLTKKQKCVLQGIRPCFSDLINLLDPDVIITCVNQNLISNYVNRSGGKCCKKIATFNEQKLVSGRVVAYVRGFCLQKSRVLVWGKNRNTPFFGWNKHEIGKHVQNCYNAVKCSTMSTLP